MVLRRDNLSRPKPARHIVIAVLNLLAVLAYGGGALNAGTVENLIVEAAGPGTFPLVQEKKATPLYLEAGDFAGVLRAAGDLQSDIARVTGVKPMLSTNGLPVSKVAIIVGTLGKSSLLDALVKTGELDSRGIAGKWEAYSLNRLSLP